jgi:hypothetical protein
MPAPPTIPYTPKIHFQEPPVPPPPAPSIPVGLPDRTGPDRTREGEEVVRPRENDQRFVNSGGGVPTPQETLPFPGPPGEQAQPSVNDTYTNQDQTDEQMRRILEMLLGGGREQAQFE